MPFFLWGQWMILFTSNHRYHLYQVVVIFILLSFGIIKLLRFHGVQFQWGHLSLDPQRLVRNSLGHTRHLFVWPYNFVYRLEHALPSARAFSLCFILVPEFVAMSLPCRENCFKSNVSSSFVMRLGYLSLRQFTLLTRLPTEVTSRRSAFLKEAGNFDPCPRFRIGCIFLEVVF